MDKGAHYYRCDLQVHTPRDLRWTGAERITDDDRRAYATQLVRKCRETGLHGIAITDHHDMAFVQYVLQAASEETNADGALLDPEQRLVVFPGMELTLGVPCQALLIFDATFPPDLFSLAMTALAITPNAPAASRTAAVNRLQNIGSLSELKRKLDDHTYLRDRYIVFPNVGESGEFSLLRKGLAGKYIDMPCVGGYVDGALTKLGTGNQNILAGKAKEWGNKRLACYQTSDNRFEDHRDLGKASTWVKWAIPTAEALRQACLAQESRIAQDEPKLPAVAISAISVSNSGFLGPADLELNPQYNALIGGRGTGKSTILEYLRWALCDQPPGPVDDDTPNYQARRRRLIEQTLKPVNATVQIRFTVNGVPHVVRRTSSDGSVQMKIGDAPLQACTEEEVRTLLPIQAYSQKQLSDVSVRVDELSRFVNAPILAELARIDRQLHDRAERLRQSYAIRQRHRALSETVQKQELEEKSLSEQADALRASLTGLSAEDRALLDRGKTYEAAERAVEVWRTGLETIGAGAKSLVGTIDLQLSGLQPPPGGPHADLLKAAHDSYRTLLEDAARSVGALADRAMHLSAKDESTSPWGMWAARLGEFRAAYDAAVQRSSAHGERLAQLKKIEEQLARQVADSARIRGELQTLAAAHTNYQAERLVWHGLLKERDDLLESQCQRLSASSDAAIKAHIRRHANVGIFVSTLTQAISGSRVQATRVQGLGSHIAAAGDAGATWGQVLADLEKLAEFDPDRLGGERRPETPALSAAGVPAGDLDRIARSLTPEAWLALSLTPVGSVPHFEYRARENEYIPFQNASAGQQATALLKTLLNEVGPPLIIDQPEDDLDNPGMPAVVEHIWGAKQKRQLIFASHNANLVVNGDAELVVWCDYRTAGDQSRGMIAGEGAIDIDDVRDAIKRIMEGGERAFLLRKEKYGF